jgi:ferredoxin
MANSPSNDSLAPELGGFLRGAEDRSGLEPELGGVWRQRGVYVDEMTCIGCRNCAHVAHNTFFIEPDHGRARVFRQDGDNLDTIQEAIDTCPVNCIQWADYTALKHLESERQYQEIPIAGFSVDTATLSAKLRRRKLERRKLSSRENG